MWARVRRATRLHLASPYTKQMTFVLQDAPQLPSNGRVIAPVPEAPTHPTASPNRLEGGKILAANQTAVMQQREEHQQV